MWCFCHEYFLSLDYQDIEDLRHAKNVITPTGKPSANQDQISPQLFETKAEMSPLATNTAKTMGHVQIAF